MFIIKFETLVRPDGYDDILLLIPIVHPDIEVSIGIFRLFTGLAVRVITGITAGFVIVSTRIFPSRKAEVQPYINIEVKIVASFVRRTVAFLNDIPHRDDKFQYRLAIGKHGLKFKYVFFGLSLMIAGKPEATHVGFDTSCTGIGRQFLARPDVCPSVRTSTICPSRSISSSSCTPSNRSLPLIDRGGAAPPGWSCGSSLEVNFARA